MISGRTASLVTVLLMLAAGASADPLAVVNNLRSNGCDRNAAAAESLRPNPALNDVARALAGNGRLEDALAASEYDAQASTSFRIRGSSDDAAIREVLAERFCDSLMNARYREAGFHQAGTSTWIVLAERVPERPPLQPVTESYRVLELINAARASERHCGRRTMPAVPPVSLSEHLSRVAAGHAASMAARRIVTHDGPDGGNVGDRLNAAGFAWRAAGENVAAGQRDADAVVAAWLQSPGHCRTLMSADFSEMGIAFALAPERDPPIYWAQVFASP